ncbi:hypothetical protein GALL_488560 [mine drainage metagenome]|uniref:Uncharacterized protein n=1 Tax=mine drainage metagenome TaxID=410659 RepID=A0A1J5PPN2_9ZZZZ
MEQTVGQAPVHQALMRAVGVTQQGFGTGFTDHGLPTADDLVQCLIPGDGRELAAALGPDAAQRGFDPLW